MMKNPATSCLAPLLALCVLSTGACGKKEGQAQGNSGAVPQPQDASKAALKEPPVIGIIRQAEEQEKIQQVNHEKVNALPKSTKQGPPPDPELQRLMTLQMDAKMKVQDYVDKLKAYQGSPLELKLAADYVRRSDLRRQVRVQGIIIRQAEEEKDAPKVAKAKELLAQRQADLKKSEEEWQGLEKGGWREMVK